jgi:hypothetical protein
MSNLDTTASSEHSQFKDSIDCELCVIGAGVCGLNALHSSSCYLSPTDRVVLVDAHSAPGGMWQDTYDYVRLHQPHPMFTVGNIPWNKQMPAPHLASKVEVSDQFGHCLNVLSKRVELHPLFGHRYISHQETPSSEGSQVEIEVQPVSGGEPRRIRARRLIKAIGYDVHCTEGLKLSSSQVHSVSPNQPAYFGHEITSSKEPIFIVGGGKTAMDTALELGKRMPGRDIRMLVGEGVMFADRSKFYKMGLDRWFGGIVAFEWLLDMALRFTGQNAEDMNSYRLDKYCIALTENPAQFQFGVLSPEEMASTRGILKEVVEDYLQDVVDTPAGPQMQMRKGNKVPIPPGSWIINCTGYIARKRVPKEPYVSESGNVLSINLSSMALFLSSFSGYYLTHLMYRNQLLSVPLYATDMTEVWESHKRASGPIAETMTVLNVLSLMKALPTKIFNECKLDFNRWYPLPRRLPILLRFMFNNDGYTAQCRKALDQFASDHQIKIGVLPHVGRRLIG